MKKSHLVPLFLIFSLLIGCNNTPNSESAEIIHLDIASGLKTKKHLLLSEIVDSIEYIKLETNKDCVLPRAYRVFGQKYLVFASRTPAKVLLFSRQGEFIRQIGNAGQGPGEYSQPNHVDLSPDEDKIVIVDGRSDSAIEYDINGNHLQTYKPLASIHQEVYYLDQETLVYIPSRPYSDSLNCPRLMALNLETKEEKPLYTIDFKFANERNGIYIDPNFIRSSTGLLFKASLGDTCYQINKDLSLIPKFSIDVGENTAPAYKVRMEDYHYDHVGYTFDLPNHILIIGSYGERFHQVFDKRTDEYYTLPAIKKCKGSGGYSYGIINDLDGLSPFWPFYTLYSRDNSFMEVHQIVDLEEWCATDCFTDSELITEKYRTQLRTLVEQSDIYDNPIIRICHLK